MNKTHIGRRKCWLDCEAVDSELLEPGSQALQSFNINPLLASVENALQSHLYPGVVVH